MTFTKKMSAMAIAGTMAITGISMAASPAFASGNAPAPAAAVSAQPKVITGYVTSTDHWGHQALLPKEHRPER